jgi:RNA polymerase sigma-70 factor (ECF subfamily)
MSGGPDAHSQSHNTDVKAAFMQAYEAYNDALFRHAFLRINNRERAVDVVHDTYAKVWNYARQGKEIASYRPFLYKVLNNLIIDEYRKAKEESLDRLLAQEGVHDGMFAELTEDTTDALIATIDGQKAFELLVELPDTYKEVIILRFVDGLGPKEISQLLEESENTVSVRIHRALLVLRKKIEAAGEFADEKRRISAKKRS